jgi:hypothetical protein
MQKNSGAGGGGQGDCVCKGCGQQFALKKASEFIEYILVVDDGKQHMRVVWFVRDRQKKNEVRKKKRKKEEGR